MAVNPVTNIRIDPELKDGAGAIFDELGLTLSTAVNVFLRAVVREGGIPFEMRVHGKTASDDNGGSQAGKDRKEPVRKAVA